MDSYWPVSFHAQQTAEKALKALLTRHQIEFEKTHNIGELLRLGGAVIPDLPQRLGETTRLTRFAVADRYPLTGPAVDPAASAAHAALGPQVLTTAQAVPRGCPRAAR